MKHLKTNRFGFVLWVCLFGVGLTGFLITFHYRRSPAIAPADTARRASLLAESGIGDSASEFRSGFVRPTFTPVSTPRLTSQESALANPGSPVNSEDSDRNRAWARAYPAEALEWVLKAASGPQRDAVMETVCPQVAETNAAAAVALAERAGSSCSNLLDNMVLQWAQQDGVAASAWAMSQPRGEKRDRLFCRIVFVESKTNPEEAARLVVEQMSPGGAQEEAAISVMHQWALNDANAALAWARQFPEGTLRDRAIGEVQNIMSMNAAAEGQPAL
jgi:hypothetical protein